MKIEVIVQNGDLKREAWTFDFSIGPGGVDIRLTAYSFQTKDTPRHKWRSQTYWDRYSRQYCNIERPTMPSAVITDMRLKLNASIKDIPVT